MIETTPAQADQSGMLKPAWWFTALVVIGLLAFALRWYYVSQAIIDRPIRGDAIQYHAYAWNMVHHGVFSRATPGSATVSADNFRDPGYPAFLALLMRIFGDYPGWYWPTLLGQALLGALTVVFLMTATRRWIPDRWLIGAGVLMAAWPHSITITSYVLSETLLGFLCALGFLLLAKTFHTRSRAFALMSGMAFGMAALTNAVLLPLIPLLCLLLWWKNGAPKKLLATLFIGAMLLPAAWMIRNTQVHAEESSSSRAMMNFVQGSWPEYHEAYFKKVIFEDPEASRILGEIDHEYRLFQASPSTGFNAVLSRLQAEPWRYVRWYLGKPALLWDWDIKMGDGDIYIFPTPYSPFRDKVPLRMLAAISHALNPVLTLLMFFGCIFILMKSRGGNPIGVALAFLAALITLVYSVLQSEPRYSIPFRGIEALLAIYACWKVATWIETRRQAAAPTPSREAP